MKKLLLISAATFGMSISAHAISITGGISFFGSYAPQDSSSVLVSNLDDADQISFGTTVVGIAGTSGSFTLIPDLNPVTMFSPLVINPATLPGSSLWSTTSGGHTFTFDLGTMFVSPVVNVGDTQSLTVSGAGLLGYSGPAGYTATPGSFSATFNRGDVTFTWSASSAASVPEGGASVVLLGLGILGLGAVRKFLAKA